MHQLNEIARWRACTLVTLQSYSGVCRLCLSLSLRCDLVQPIVKSHGARRVLLR